MAFTLPLGRLALPFPFGWTLASISFLPINSSLHQAALPSFTSSLAPAASTASCSCLLFLGFLSYWPCSGSCLPLALKLYFQSAQLFSQLAPSATHLQPFLSKALATSLHLHGTRAIPLWEDRVGSKSLQEPTEVARWRPRFLSRWHATAEQESARRSCAGRRQGPQLSSLPPREVAGQRQLGRVCFFSLWQGGLQERPLLLTDRCYGQQRHKKLGVLANKRLSVKPA